MMANLEIDAEILDGRIKIRHKGELVEIYSMTKLLKLSEKENRGDEGSHFETSVCNLFTGHTCYV